MLYIAFVVFWAVILTPLAIGYLRDRGPEKSIQHFHEEHARFAEREHSTEPVNRLAEGYARPVGRGTVFADDNYDYAYSSNEVQEFADTTPGRQYASRRSSRQRRLIITVILFTLSIASWMGAVFVGGYALYAGIVMGVLDASYVGLYFVAVRFGLMGYVQKSYLDDPIVPVGDFAQYRDAGFEDEQYAYPDDGQFDQNYPRGALG